MSTIIITMKIAVVVIGNEHECHDCHCSCCVRCADALEYARCGKCGGFRSPSTTTHAGNAK